MSEPKRRMARGRAVLGRPIELEESGPCLVCGAPLAYKRDPDKGHTDGFINISADCQCGFGFNSKWPADALGELRRLATRDRALNADIES